ncbi:protein-glutamate O-methyltransferase CheR [Exilibacterium tricleocarpae]|uniref:protein-glutamate O-methyltransferase n=1 Tax=Exilibacterium tricleocarpae TaxID=2591008 RepID=A0A545U3T1_9GAMM|nr:protein-glutamate O-methyltransferase CheR [Exilibacterium tricleocarpae]TQV84129.1 protein-glutamate O-methyltransferase CheR [Exilibacterium tricleocarpae]
MANDVSARQDRLQQGDFEYFRQFLQDACGISLGENKQYLVTTRVRGILSDNNLESLKALVDQMKQPRHSQLRDQVIDAMTTNETFWFRDVYPFEYLKNVLFDQLQQDGASAGAIRMWCAACASGQEPYSISIAVEEHRYSKPGAGPREVKIVATDLSTSSLIAARCGEYDSSSVQRGLVPERLNVFFDRCEGDRWRVKPAVRNRVEFRTLNLMDSYAVLGKFDVIFCRNVLIYFSGDLKRDILRRLHCALKPGGLLFLGASEGLAGVADLFEMVHCKPGILYRAL